MKKLIDLQHPWFIPIWRRILVTGICAAWLVVEIVVADPLWTVLFGALTAYCVYEFFFNFNPPDPEA